MTSSRQTLLEIESSFSYCQIWVHDSDVQNPFSVRTQQHTAQGFIWRGDAITFDTYDSNWYHVRCYLSDSINVSESAQRAIILPFSSSTGVVNFQVSYEAQSCNVEPGCYAVLYELWRMNEEACMCQFTFVPFDNVEPQILRADDELSPPTPLLMKSSVLT